MRRRRGSCRCSRRGRGVVVDADAVVGRESGKAGAPALADGTKLPCALAAVDLPEDEGGLRRGVGDVETDQLGAAGSVTVRCSPVAWPIGVPSVDAATATVSISAGSPARLISIESTVPDFPWWVTEPSADRGWL